MNAVLLTKYFQHDGFVDGFVAGLGSDADSRSFFDVFLVDLIVFKDRDTILSNPLSNKKNHCERCK